MHCSNNITYTVLSVVLSCLLIAGVDMSCFSLNFWFCFTHNFPGIYGWVI